MRPAVVLLFLVVLPTALLSIMAGRSIQAREVLLQRRIEQDALDRISAVNNALADKVSGNVERVAAIFRQADLAGSAPQMIEPQVERLLREIPEIAEIYLFMNPWDFIYPRPDASHKDDSGDDAGLRQELITRISAARGMRSLVCFRYAGEYFCFRRLAGFSEIYAGYRLRKSTAVSMIQHLLREKSSGGVVLRAVGGEGLFSGASQDMRVVVSDSFRSRPAVVSGSRRRLSDDTRKLVSGQLTEPFDDVRIEAFSVSAADIMEKGRLESNLIKWGVFLLAVIITVSSGMLIQRTVTRAERARRNSEFVVGMSHDLRTPLASMRILADSLCAGRVADPQKRQEFMCTIAGECERLGDMIERILFFLRSEHGSITYNMRPLNIGEIVADAVQTMEKRFQGRLAVKLELEESLPRVCGDADALTRVVTNMLGNAVKYGNEPGHPKVSVEVSLAKRMRRGREWVTLKVADRGRGIARSEQKKIFRRFYRVGGGENEHIGGIGLGLSLCAEIVKAHRGRIELKSAPGEGAAFIVWLRGA